MLASIQTLDPVSNASMQIRRSVCVPPSHTIMVISSHLITECTVQQHSSMKALYIKVDDWHGVLCRWIYVKTSMVLGLSPGNNTIKYADKCQKRRIKKQQTHCLPSTKRRRLVLKQERAICQGELESLEGVSYQSVRGTVIPHITQIAATEIKSVDSFSVYSKPLFPITTEAQRITGICFSEDSGEMFAQGKHAECLKIQSALQKLCHWLTKYSNVFLVAHNGL